ncbi:50s ribosomal protein l13e [Fusarium sporotrichioides]|uniref:60S ribosomal protein L13 n=1 Tax=Fusarium sporotrichioides TaxID=5514 RepID=A0A395RIG1_FUSSP|nr:50s ribosomal protein l13e [Fusarium sporotrichioides]
MEFDKPQPSEISTPHDPTSTIGARRSGTTRSSSTTVSNTLPDERYHTREDEGLTPRIDFRKDWQRRVRTHFDQPGKKSRRRTARQAKAAALAPRPVDKLRPVVRCPTIKYNRRVRSGRGFTLAELKEAGIPKAFAPTIGIAVDFRRQNLSEESLAANVARLKAYQERLILLPRRSNAPKKGDTKTDVSKVEKVSQTAAAFPIAATDLAVKEISKSDMPSNIEAGAYRTLRVARANARYEGARQKRIRDAAEAESAKK